MQMFKLEFYEAIARVSDMIEYDENKSVDGYNPNIGSLKDISRRIAKGNGQLNDEKNYIVIDDKVGEEEVLSNYDSDSSENNFELPNYDFGMMKTSTFVSTKDLNFGRNNKNFLDDNSAYSLGDNEKLYQKLEKFIKILINNWYKQKLKRMSSKQNKLMVNKPNAFIIGRENVNLPKSNTPQKNLNPEKYSFKRSFSKNVGDRNKNLEVQKKMLIPQSIQSDSSLLKVNM